MAYVCLHHKKLFTSPWSFRRRGVPILTGLLNAKKALDSGVGYRVYDDLYGGREARFFATSGLLESLKIDRRKT